MPQKRKRTRVLASEVEVDCRREAAEMRPSFRGEGINCKAVAAANAASSTKARTRFLGRKRFVVMDAAARKRRAKVAPTIGARSNAWNVASQARTAVAPQARARRVLFNLSASAAKSGTLAAIVSPKPLK